MSDSNKELEKDLHNTIFRTGWRAGMLHVAMIIKARKALNEADVNELLIELSKVTPPNSEAYFRE